MSGLSVAAQASTITYTVGSGNGFDFSTVSAATNAETGPPGTTYIINVAPGTYLNDFPTINQPTTIEATGPGVILEATGPISNNQGIIETFAPLTVNGLTLIGAVAQDSNSSAAAIRDHNNGGGNLIVENSLIENSQSGIQTSSDSGNVHQENVTITNETFVGDGGSIGRAHAVYIGDAATADIINSTFCGTASGHDIKSRALSTTITGSTLYVGAVDPNITACATNPGSTSAGVDLPNGGVGVIDNDTIIQGAYNTNRALVIHGGESPFNTPASLDVSGASFLGDGANDRSASNELGGCLAPVTGTETANFQNLNSNISPAGCIAAAATAVAEPHAFVLLLTALVLTGVARRSNRMKGVPQLSA